MQCLFFCKASHDLEKAEGDIAGRYRVPKSKEKSSEQGYTLSINIVLINIFNQDFVNVYAVKISGNCHFMPPFPDFPSMHYISNPF